IWISKHPTDHHHTDRNNRSHDIVSFCSVQPTVRKKASACNDGKKQHKIMWTLHKHPKEKWKIDKLSQSTPVHQKRQTPRLMHTITAVRFIGIQFQYTFIH